MNTLYLSQVLGEPVRDSRGDVIAKTQDVVVRVGEQAYPPVIGLVARTGTRTFFLPIADIAQLDEHGATLGTDVVNLRTFERRDNEMLLRADLLDKRAVDLRRNKIVRVNDLVISREDQTLRLVAVDASNVGLLRRLGLLPLAQWLAGIFRFRLAPQAIPWEEIDHFASEVPQVHLAISHARLAKLHPADIAQLVSELPHRQGSELIGSFDNQLAADVLEEMPDEDQADYLEDMDAQRAADILAEMSPDEAADVLGDMTDEKSEELLHMMTGEESRPVEQLLSYPEDTAGGIMTTDYVAIPQDLTAAEAIGLIRRLPDRPEVIQSVYVLSDEGGPLVGAVPLQDLLLADPGAKLTEIMTPNIPTARPLDEQEEVARKIARYNLLALPITDEHEHLLGIVTVDDALDILLPSDWKKRMPNIFRR